MKKIIVLTVLFALLVSLVPLPTYTAYAAITDVKAVATSGYHLAIIKTDNTLWVYGANSSGQLGTGNQEDKTEPVQVLDNIKAVDCGRSTTIALKTDGSVWVFGYNADEQLGTKAKPKETGGVAKADDRFVIDTPTQLMTGVKAISAGDDYMLALKTDGSLYSWGSNVCYQLGIDDYGQHTPSANATNTSRGIVYCYKPTKILSGVASISAGEHHAAAVKTDGSLWTWGDNSPHAQCGIDITGGYITKPTKVMDSGVKAVSCSDITTAIIKTDNTLWMCGSNDSGQLGIGYVDSDGEPITRKAVPVKVLSGVKSVSALGECTLALKTDGTLWTWGMDGFSKKPTTEPTERVSDIKALCIGARVAIKGDGSLYRLKAISYIYRLL